MAGFNFDGGENMVKRYNPAEMTEAFNGGWVRGSDYDALQAKLDAVMLEYCPNEMTPQQRYNWENAQRSARSGEVR